MTLSTFPQVPLTREPTCTQAIDPGTSGSTLTAADTSRPPRRSGIFPDFPWSGSPWLTHGSPLHGDWFSNPTGLCLSIPRLSSSPGSQPREVPPSCATSRHPSRPIPCIPHLPILPGLLCALATRPSLSLPLLTSSRFYTPAGRQQPCGAGPLDRHPSRDRFVRLARFAPFPLPSLSTVPRPVTHLGLFPESCAFPFSWGCCATLATHPSLSRPISPSSRVYTQPGCQQPFGAGPLDPHPSGDRFVRLARVAPFPPPFLWVVCFLLDLLGAIGDQKPWHEHVCLGQNA